MDTMILKTAYITMLNMGNDGCTALSESMEFLNRMGI